MLTDTLPIGFIAWVCAAVALAVVEIFTAGFFFLFFALGALVTAGVAWFSDSLLVQMLAFLASSLLMVFFARPMVQNAFGITDKPVKESNVQALLGQDVLVLEPVGKYGGRVKVLHTGEVWTAVLDEALASGDVLAEGTEGVISRVDGAKLVVAPRHPAETAGSSAASA